MSKTGKKLIQAAKEAVKAAKCEHAYVKGSDGGKGLRCMLCGAVVHTFPRDQHP